MTTSMFPITLKLLKMKLQIEIMPNGNFMYFNAIRKRYILQNCNGNTFIYAEYIQLQTAEKGEATECSLLQWEQTCQNLDPSWDDLTREEKTLFCQIFVKFIL